MGLCRLRAGRYSGFLPWAEPFGTRLASKRITVYLRFSASNSVPIR